MAICERNLGVYSLLRFLVLLDRIKVSTQFGIFYKAQIKIEYKLQDECFGGESNFWMHSSIENPDSKKNQYVIILQIFCPILLFYKIFFQLKGIQNQKQLSELAQKDRTAPFLVNTVFLIKSDHIHLKMVGSYNRIQWHFFPSMMCVE